MKKLAKLQSKKILTKKTIRGGAGPYEDFTPTTSHGPSSCPENNGHISCDHGIDNIFPGGDMISDVPGC